MDKQIKVKPKLFSRSKTKQNKSIRLAPEMWNAIETVADRKGWSTPGLIEFVLENYLQDEVEEGTITAPEIKKEDQ